MKSNKAVLMKISVFLLVTCLSLLAPVQFTVSKQYAFQINLTQAKAAIPLGWESYLDRPDILKVDASEHNLGGNWSKIKEAHFSFVAEILELY